VIAIAITLLVLELGVPKPESPGTLAHKLAEQWPSYAAYVVSFVTIGVIWVNHHAMLRRVQNVDHSALVLNLLLLMLIAVLPWTTALLADYLREDEGQHLAAAIYAGSLLAMGLSFFAMQRHLLVGKPHLAMESIGPAERTAIMRRNMVGLLPYFVATAVAPLSSYLVLAICGAVGVYYALPTTNADS
jgi:TMEM175 potassium channel family protein